MNYEKTATQGKGTGRTVLSPNPAFDKLMVPHGFTQASTTSRARTSFIALVRPARRSIARSAAASPSKEGWQFLAKDGGNFKIWDVPRRPVSRQQRPQGVQAGHCGRGQPGLHGRARRRTMILDWAYMGDPVAGRKVEPHVESRRLREET
jgi:hypothetical protein